jgi:hypothetical protein
MKKRRGGGHVRARGCVCVTAGGLTAAMIKNYRAHYVEPKGEDKFRTETGTGLMARIRTLGPYTNPPA